MEPKQTPAQAPEIVNDTEPGISPVSDLPEQPEVKPDIAVPAKRFSKRTVAVIAIASVVLVVAAGFVYAKYAGLGEPATKETIGTSTSSQADDDPASKDEEASKTDNTNDEEDTKSDTTKEDNEASTTSDSTSSSTNSSSSSTNTSSPSSGGGTSGNVKIAAQTYEISYTNNCYTPANRTIKKGDTIKFINNSTRSMEPASDDHPSHTIYSAFDANNDIAPSGTYSFTFTKVGTWGYHDHNKPSCMGTITVTL